MWGVVASYGVERASTLCCAQDVKHSRALVADLKRSCVDFQDSCSGNVALA